MGWSGMIIPFLIEIWALKINTATLCVSDMRIEMDGKIKESKFEKGYNPNYTSNTETIKHNPRTTETEENQTCSETSLVYKKIIFDL